MLLPVLFLVKPTGCHLSDDHLADLLLREGNYLISENQDLTFLNYRRVSQKGRRKRTKRAYWGFDKLYADAVETKNDFTRLGQMIGGFIKENTQVYIVSHKLHFIIHLHRITRMIIMTTITGLQVILLGPRMGTAIRSTRRPRRRKSLRSAAAATPGYSPSSPWEHSW